MSVKRLLCGLVFAAAVAPAAQAEVIDMHFQDAPGAGSLIQVSGPNVYLDSQIAFRAAAATGDFDFEFTYDPTTAGPNHSLTLVSGRVGTITDFSEFTASLQFTASDVFQLSLNRVEHAGVATYTSGVFFTFQDNDGDIPATLPTTLDLAALDQANVSFETRRSGGIGDGYYNYAFTQLSGTFEPLAPTEPDPQDPPGSTAPEPAAWALMILGFGAAGAGLRRRRVLA
jgi:hypothetical protein